MSRRGATPRRRAASHARRPAPRIRQRVRRALPAPGRIAAVLLTAVLVGGLLALINGPWLRVARVAWAGEQYTPVTQLQRALGPLRGTSLLTVDAMGLAAALERLPAIASARVQAVLPDAVKVTLVEKVPTFVWQTTAVRLLGAADGTLIGQLALEATLPNALAALPFVDDRRLSSRSIIVGDRIEAATLAAGLRLCAVVPAVLGSRASELTVRLTDDDGFLVVSPAPGWEADFGLYPSLDVGERGTLATRVSAQVAAIRTLFSSRPESSISWVDVRDPGRVYWRP